MPLNRTWDSASYTSMFSMGMPGHLKLQTDKQEPKGITPYEVEKAHASRQKTEAQSDWQKQVTYSQGSHVRQSGKDGSVVGKDLSLRRIQNGVAVLVTSYCNTRHGH